MLGFVCQPLLMFRAMVGVAAAGLCCASVLAAGNAPLSETRWVLQTLDGAPKALASQGEAVHLQLHGSQHISGFTGCNRLGGRYLRHGTQLALQVQGSTRKVCPAAQMQQEQRFIELLAVTDGYRIEGRVLSLLQGETVRATFKSTR